MENVFLDQILIPLADQFEARNRNRWHSFETGHGIGYEGLRECLAELVAEGSVLRHPSERFKFSDSGYTKYIHRIRALRALNP